MRGLLSKRKIGDSSYPKQFWLLFWGVFINRISSSMIWPFLTVYMSQILDVPLTIVALLLTLRAVFSFLSTAIVSPIMDKFGRKGAMVFSLLASIIVFMGMAQGTSSLLFWAILSAGHGVVLPIFNIGVQTMVADSIPKEKRSTAYALIRTVSNAGIAIGPVLGGLLAIISFSFIFYGISVVYFVLAILVGLLIQETKPESNLVTDAQSSGYGFILRDHTFLIFIMGFFVLAMAFANMFTLLPVYLSDNFAMGAREYSLTLSVNAAMVVFFQYAVTKFSARYKPYTVLTVGAAMYTLGLLSVIFGVTLSHFLLSMAIVTFGELLVMPTASTLVADIAPDNMRARYLGILSLGWPIGAGFGPVIGGLLNDNIAPVAIWYGSGVMAMIGMTVFFALARNWRKQQVALQITLQ
ncbi:MAG: MFS transporter [Anaerolineae bacterium]|nr:MFS transporter [Anaerolineae bacterium]MDQ7036789.1 MFS transporter [Anaerolineae bacterium]